MNNNEHCKIWNTIDKIAYVNGMSVSALARKSGLDATAFNKSKRQYPSGKCRWPSTESISKVIGATNMTWTQFTAFLEAQDFQIGQGEMNTSASLGINVNAAEDKDSTESECSPLKLAA